MKFEVYSLEAQESPGRPKEEPAAKADHQEGEPFPVKREAGEPLPAQEPDDDDEDAVFEEKWAPTAGSEGT